MAGICTFTKASLCCVLPVVQQADSILILVLLCCVHDRLFVCAAPNKEEFHKETVRKLQGLHKFDCLRANKSTAAWGVEARVPFLDKEFLDYAMGMMSD